MDYRLAQKISTIISNSIRYNKKFDIVTVGSVIRKNKIVNDLDFLIITPTEDKKILYDFQFTDKVEVLKEINCGPKRCSLELLVDNKKVKSDFFYTTKKDKAFAQLYTESGLKYNLRVRRLAKLKGYKLSQYGLFYETTNKHVPGKFKTVADIQRFLGVKVKHPEDRDL